MTHLAWVDPETFEEERLDLSGWRFRVTYGENVLADVPILTHFLRASIEIELEQVGEFEGLIAFGRGVAPLSVSYTEGVPVVVAYVREEGR